MKKVYVWFEYLPEKIRDKAQAYFFEYKKPHNYEHKESSLYHAIIGGFYWGDTKEGADYWFSIYRKYKNFKP